MNKEAIIKEINKLGLNKNEFWVLGSASLVLRDLLEQANDIDLAVTTNLYKELEKKYELAYLGINNDSKWYKLNDNIELCVDVINTKKVEYKEPFNLINLAYYYYNFLKNSKREKDKLKKEIILKVLKYREYLEFAKEIAYEAGKIIRKYFIEDSEAGYKIDNTIVTKADKDINKLLIDKVKEKYPTHSIDGEEEKNGNSNYVWICDPVDGTAMYARHIPVSVFSLALVIDGISTIGVVYDVFTDNLYSAIKGEGAFKNNNKITVNNIELNDKRSVCNVDMWPNADYNLFDTIKELGKKSYLVGLGSITRACMCVASGDFTLAIFPGTKGKYYDIAASKVIVEEAGGKVTDLFGKEQRYDCDINGAIISNSIVHSEVVNLVKKNIKD